LGQRGCEDDLKTTEIERRRRSSEALNRGGGFGEEVLKETAMTLYSYIY